MREVCLHRKKYIEWRSIGLEVNNLSNLSLNKIV